MTTPVFSHLDQITITGLSDPILRSAEPGETSGWCHIDNLTFELDSP